MPYPLRHRREVAPTDGVVSHCALDLSQELSREERAVHELGHAVL
ncbi:hypothetical protein [Kitasatospora sp. NPDC057223]